MRLSGGARGRGRAHLAGYGLLVLPGLELTYDDPEPARAAHALALGLRRFVGLEDGFERALARGARARLPAVATGDFHHRDHFATWKTLLPCPPEEEAIVEHLRSGRRVDLTRVEPPAAAAELAA
jgi:hypothetical protein